VVAEVQPQTAPLAEARAHGSQPRLEHGDEQLDAAKMVGVGQGTGSPFHASAQARPALTASVERGIHVDEIKTLATLGEVGEARQAVTLGDTAGVLFIGF
jgi:hypothetical protein